MNITKTVENLYNDTIKNPKDYLARDLGNTLKSIHTDIIKNSGEHKENHLREFAAAINSSWENALKSKDNVNNIDGITKDMAWSLMCILSNQEDNIFRGEDAIERD